VGRPLIGRKAPDEAGDTTLWAILPAGTGVSDLLKFQNFPSFLAGIAAARMFRCAAARKMRLTFKQAGILTAGRCALFAFRGRAERTSERCSAVNLRAANVTKTRMGGLQC